LPFQRLTSAFQMAKALHSTQPNSPEVESPFRGFSIQCGRRHIGYLLPFRPWEPGSLTLGSSQTGGGQTASQLSDHPLFGLSSSTEHNRRAAMPTHAGTTSQGLCPYNARGEGSTLTPGLPGPARSALRVSHPPGGLLLPTPSGHFQTGGVHGVPIRCLFPVGSIISVTHLPQSPDLPLHGSPLRPPPGCLTIPSSPGLSIP
jgi:hypothetical protein